MPTVCDEATMTESVRKYPTKPSFPKSKEKSLRPMKPPKMHPKPN